jgi:hypothetical protein
VAADIHVCVPTSVFPPGPEKPVERFVQHELSTSLQLAVTAAKDAVPAGRGVGKLIGQELCVRYSVNAWP